MANLAQVLDTAQRVYLNDANKRVWTRAQLVPFAKEAHRQLQVQLQLNGIAVIKNQTFTTTVPAFTLPYLGYVLMPNQPTNIIEPINCFERPTGSTLNSDWELMTQKSFTPTVDPVQDLFYWSWIGENIVFVGATQSNDVKLEYNGGITIPDADSDPIGVVNGEVYIAPKLAALASASVGGTKRAKENEDIAREQLELILCTKVLAEQGMVARRRPYRHGRVPHVIR